MAGPERNCTRAGRERGQQAWSAERTNTSKENSTKKIVPFKRLVSEGEARWTNTKSKKQEAEERKVKLTKLGR
jgi:hypothetical protein